MNTGWIDFKTGEPVITSEELQERINILLDVNETLFLDNERLKVALECAKTLMLSYSVISRNNFENLIAEEIESIDTALGKVE